MTFFAKIETSIRWMILFVNKRHKDSVSEFTLRCLEQCPNRRESRSEKANYMDASIHIG